jgi:hypothetical protein
VAVSLTFSPLVRLTAADSADEVYKLIDPAPLEEPFSIHLDAVAERRSSDDHDTGLAGGSNAPSWGTAWGDLLVSLTAQEIGIAAPNGQGTAPTRLRAADGVAVCRVMPGDGWVLGLQWDERRSSDGSLAWRQGTDREVDIFVRYDLGNRQALVALASFASQRRWIDAPFIPGIAWLIAPDEQHWLLVGAPVAYGYWQPVPLWSIEGGVIQDPHAALSFYPASPWTVALEWDWRQSGFRSAAGTSVLEEMRLALTAAFDPTAWCEIRGLAGAAFDRTLRVGADRHGRGGDPQGLESGPVIGIGLSAGF